MDFTFNRFLLLNSKRKLTEIQVKPSINSKWNNISKDTVLFKMKRSIVLSELLQMLQTPEGGRDSPSPTPLMGSGCVGKGRSPQTEYKIEYKAMQKMGGAEKRKQSEINEKRTTLLSVKYLDGLLCLDSWVDY